MKQKQDGRDIVRRTRRHFGAEDKIRILLKGIRSEESIAEICRKEGLHQSLYHRWSKEFRDVVSAKQVFHDPWVVISALFDPCYIGGWSAAVHWGFTEHIFDSIHVFTPRAIGSKAQEHHGTKFVLKHIKTENMFGLKVLWRDNTEVNISDKHRTLMDMLSSPRAGGGIEHVAACLKNYFSDKESDMNQLVTYAERYGNSGGVFKRLGFLAEKMGMEPLAGICRERITTGTVKLDPAILNSRMVSRWALWVPRGWEKD